MYICVDPPTESVPLKAVSQALPAGEPVVPPAPIITFPPIVTSPPLASIDTSEGCAAFWLSNVTLPRTDRVLPLSASSRMSPALGEEKLWSERSPAKLRFAGRRERRDVSACKAINVGREAGRSGRSDEDAGVSAGNGVP